MKSAKILRSWPTFSSKLSPEIGNPHGGNLDAVTAVTDSFKMADAFDGAPTGGAVAQTNAQTIDISVVGCS